MLQRQPNAVQTVQHAVAAEVVDFKSCGLIACFHHLCFQIHFKFNARIRFSPEQTAHRPVSLRVTAGSSWLLKAVAVEDVGF